MARSFDNTNDTITFTLAANQTTLATISVGCWFYPDNTDHYKRLWQLGPAYPNLGCNTEWNNRTAPPNIFRFNARWTGNANPYAMGEWALPSTGAWHHSLTTYDWGSTANKPEHYLDGSIQTRTNIDTPSGSPVNTSTAFYIGSDAATGSYFGGDVAEFAIWNRVLTAAEAAILGDGFSPLFIPNGLVFYTPLIGRTSPEIELRYGSSGTVSGAVVADHPRIIYPTFFQDRRFTTAVAGGGGGNMEWPGFQSRGFWSPRFT